MAESPLDQLLEPSGASPVDSDRQENILTNHLSVMLSRMFRQRLAKSFTPAEGLEIQQPYLKKGQQPSPSILMTVLAKKISVTREREKDFFTVRVRHVSPQTALLIANRFTATYLQLVQSELHRANQAAADILGKQASALSNEILEIENERREYRRQHNLISAEENQVILEDRLKQVNLARSDLRVQRARLEAEVRQAGGRPRAKSPLPFTNSTLSAYAGTPLLRQNLNSLLVRKDVLSIRYGPKHARMIEVKGSIAATRNALERNFRDAFLDLKSQLNLAVEAEKGLNAEFDAAFNESLELSRLAGRLNSLAQEAANKRKTLDELLQRIGKAAIDTGLPADVLRVVDAGYIRYSLVPMLAIYAAVIGLFQPGRVCGRPAGDQLLRRKNPREYRFREQAPSLRPRRDSAAEPNPEGGASAHRPRQRGPGLGRGFPDRGQPDRPYFQAWVSPAHPGHEHAAGRGQVHRGLEPGGGLYQARPPHRPG